MADLRAIDGTTCTVHGMVGHAGRKRARQVARSWRPGQHLSPWKCDATGLFHLGNLPDRIRVGEADRDTINNKIIN